MMLTTNGHSPSTSYSTWSSALHMVLNKSPGDWSPCGATMVPLTGRLPLPKHLDYLSSSRCHSDFIMLQNISSMVSLQHMHTLMMSSLPVPPQKNTCQDLHTVFQKLTFYGIIINPNKCLFTVPSIKFLGHLNDTKGLPCKVKAIQEFPQPPPKDNYIASLA